MQEQGCLCPIQEVALLLLSLAWSHWEGQASFPISVHLFLQTDHPLFIPHTLGFNFCNVVSPGAEGLRKDAHAGPGSRLGAAAQGT